MKRCSVADPEEAADCRQGALSQHKERLPQADLRGTSTAPRALLQSLSR